MAENFRREPIRSREYLDGSRDQPCVFQIPGVCIGGSETTVACHLHDETFGLAEKADDTSTGDGCRACHDAMDGRSMVLSERDWLFYAFRAVQRTIRNRVLRKIVQIKLDVPKPASDRPVKPRKPRAARAKLPSNPDRKIPSRPMRRQETAR
jgi:hypothetical protein